MVERRPGAYDPTVAPDSTRGAIEAADDAPSIPADAEWRGLRLSGLLLLAAIAVILLVTAPPGAPLGDPVTGSIIGTSPSIDSLIVIISLLFLLIAQCIAYVNYSTMSQVAAVKLGDLIENLDIRAGWLLLITIAITLVAGFVIPQAIAKWALLAPIFIPILMRLGVDLAAVLAAYRVGDLPVNIVTPIMACSPVIVAFAARIDR